LDGVKVGRSVLIGPSGSSSRKSGDRKREKRPRSVEVGYSGFATPFSPNWPVDPAKPEESSNSLNSLNGRGRYRGTGRIFSARVVRRGDDPGTSAISLSRRLPRRSGEGEVEEWPAKCVQHALGSHLGRDRGDARIVCGSSVGVSQSWSSGWERQTASAPRRELEPHDRSKLRWHP
jgi:hypothetical protein